MKPERIHLILGLVYFLLGMLLGEHMGRSGDYAQMPTHAHIMLVGGVLPILWAIIYRLFIKTQGMLAYIQTGVHHVATVIMVICLYLLYGQMSDPGTLGPILGVTALLLITSVALMLYQVIRASD